MPAVEVEGKGEKVVDDVEFDRYGFYQPPKIQRKLPIYLKGADPKQCLDIIDDLYAFYVDMEVSVCGLIVTVVCDGCVCLDGFCSEELLRTSERSHSSYAYYPRRLDHRGSLQIPLDSCDSVDDSEHHGSLPRET